MKSNLTEKWIVCRICLQQPKETMQSIFDNNETNDFTNMIHECGGVPIQKFDHYPDKICLKCLKYLRVAYKFRITCQRSHKHLSRFIAPVVVQKEIKDLEATTSTEEVVVIPADTITSSNQLADEILVEMDEVEEDDEVALKYEQDDEEMGIKQECSDGENVEIDEIVDIFVPMEDEAEEEVDGRSVNAEGMEDIDEGDFEDFVLDDGSNPIKAEDTQFLDELLNEDDDDTSDEEFVLPVSAQRKAKKVTTTTKIVAQKAKEKTQKPTTSNKSTSVVKKDNGLKKVSKPRRPKDSSYICDICGNIYPTQGRLTEHIKLHKGIRPHECEICGHCFAQTQQLTRHMNTHTGNRPYKCSYCTAAFADLSTRNKHHRIHTNERPYVCDVCGKTFTYTNTLKFHKMIHTGEKPFVCDICGKGFQQNYKLRNHKMTHERRGIKLEKVETDSLSNYQEVHVATAHILEI